MRYVFFLLLIAIPFAYANDDVADVFTLLQAVEDNAVSRVIDTAPIMRFTEKIDTLKVASPTAIQAIESDIARRIQIDVDPRKIDALLHACQVSGLGLSFDIYTAIRKSSKWGRVSLAKILRSNVQPSVIPGLSRTYLLVLLSDEDGDVRHSAALAYSAIAPTDNAVERNAHNALEISIYKLLVRQYGDNVFGGRDKLEPITVSPENLNPLTEFLAQLRVSVRFIPARPYGPTK